MRKGESPSKIACTLVNGPSRPFADHRSPSAIPGKSTMVRLPASRRLLSWAVPALLVTASAQATNDADHVLQKDRVAAIADPATTATLLRSPDEQLRADAPADQGALKTAVEAYRRGAVTEGD